MRTTPFPGTGFANSSLGYSRRRGIALIIVLSILVLITGLVVGFLARVGTERVSAGNFNATTNTHQLADAAVNLVQGQINQATSRGSTYAWASQPGAVRVFNNAGRLDTIYRLYSAPSLNATKGSDLAGDLPTDVTWPQKPAQWVDLNAPSQVTGLKDPAGNALIGYPIVDPRDPNSNTSPPANLKMNGFQINSFPGAIPGSNAVMPVQWLYVLQDGRILPPSSTTGTSVTVAQASATNPIVGRIAFWADDETCKTNINTAGGDGLINSTEAPKTNVSLTATRIVSGKPFYYKFPNTPANVTFWDTPRFNAPEDTNMAVCQPAAGEFQRYPGHPATVGLRDTLDSLGLSLINSPDVFYGLLPRYANGGSLGGTFKNATTYTISGRAKPGQPIPLKSAPLYATVGEMLFSGTSVPSRRASVLNQTNAVTRQRMETARFFLSAHSRAPELNLFGQPRVSMWPVYNAAIKPGAKVPIDPKHVTPVDQLLAFSATTGSGGTIYPYYFVRRNPSSSVIDVGLKLSGAAFGNQALLTNYLDRLTSNPIPGFGGKFSNKYGIFGTHQILTEIFDYIRTINTRDAVLIASGGTQYVPYWSPSFPTSQITPTKVSAGGWNTQGFGDYPKLVEVALQFVWMGVAGDPVPPVQLKSPVVQHDPKISGTAGVPVGATAVQAFLQFAFIDHSHWCMPENPNFYFRVTGQSGFSLSGTSLGFKDAPSDNTLFRLQIRTDGGTGFGGNTGYLCPYNFVVGRPLGTSDPTTKYPFYSKIFLVSGTTPTTPMPLSGAKLTVQIYDGSITPSFGNPNAGVFQTYTITVPPSTPLLPLKPMFRIIGTSGTTQAYPMPANATTDDRWYLNHDTWHKKAGWDNIKVGGIAHADHFLIDSNDTVQSMILSSNWADPRLLALTTIQGAGAAGLAFVKHPSWGQRQAHNLFYTYTIPFIGNNTFGSIVPGLSYTKGSFSSPQPMIPPSVDPAKGALTTGGAPGDWDNGTGNSPDGPWINKVDEGDMPTPPVNGVGGTGYYDGNTGATYNTDYISYYDDYGHGQSSSMNSSTFSPNRQIPSPVMFGSLPTGVDPIKPKPWQTLLFRPGSGGAGKPKHPGEKDVPNTGDPADHLLLDLFWMPMDEPYAISEPFSTAGKVNLNYQIVPFNYITRRTALCSVLASEKVAQVPGSQAALYKCFSDGGTQMDHSRLSINVAETLRQFDAKFTAWDIYRSASEICDIWLVPQAVPDAASYTLESFPAKWYDNTANGDFAMVGDNVRERPYANIYPRVTTKSNTFTVYFTVQALKNANPQTDSGQRTWIENKGAITGEYRGSTILERYIDPNGAIPDFASALAGSSVANQTLESAYKWRIIENHQFAP